MNPDQHFDSWSDDEPTHNQKKRDAQSNPNIFLRFSKSFIRLVTDRLPVLWLLKRRDVNRMNVLPTNNTNKNRKWLSQRKVGAVGCILVFILGILLLPLDMRPGISLRFASYDSSYLWWS